MNSLKLKYNKPHSDRYYVKENANGKTTIFGMWVTEDVLTAEQKQNARAAWTVTSIYDSGVEYIWSCIVKTEHTERKSHDLTLRLAIR